MLCSGDVPRGLMMAAYDVRRLTEQAFDVEKSRDRRLRAGNMVTMLGRYTIQFIVQMILAKIRAVLGEKDVDSRYTVEGILAILSTLDVLEYDGRGGGCRRSRRASGTCRLCSISRSPASLYIMSRCSTPPPSFRRAGSPSGDLGFGLGSLSRDYRTKRNFDSGSRGPFYSSSHSPHRLRCGGRSGARGCHRRSACVVPDFLLHRPPIGDRASGPRYGA